LRSFDAQRWVENGMRKWLTALGASVLALLVVAAIGAAAVEHHARARTLAQYPPQGRLVDIGGRRIQLDCRGTGAPVVVFEAGRDLRGSLSWYRVHDDVASFTRACAYSRAGILWSDPKDARPTGKGAADDLHATLTRASERGPFVLVGHSAGGLAILLYTKYYPSEVGGLVFVDSSHPEQFERFMVVKGLSRPSLGFTDKLMRSFAWSGALRWYAPQSPTDDSEAMKIVAAFGTVSWVGATREIEEDDDWFGNAGTVHSLGSRPTFVLSGMKSIPARLGLTPAAEAKRLEVWRAMQNELAALSTVSRHDEDFDSDHYVQVNDPKRVVAGVKWVVDTIREGPSAPRSPK
jgi:pimeloyl-ACP methyl ester carboxylesterase